MVPFNLKVLAKFGLCSNCSQKLDECSLDRTRKISATRMNVLETSIPSLLAFYANLRSKEFFAKGTRKGRK